MKNVELVRLEPSIEQALADDRAYFAAMVACDWDKVANLVHRSIGRTLEATPVSVDRLVWDGYFVIDAETREVVGSCAFKGEPTTNGNVEIAYLTYPMFAGQGYATAMAKKLIDLAREAQDIREVLAHTLPETNASTRVLQKVGMNCVGEVTDPEDGTVWRWQIAAS